MQKSAWPPLPNSSSQDNPHSLREFLGASKESMRLGGSRSKAQKQLCKLLPLLAAPDCCALGSAETVVLVVYASDFNVCAYSCH